jgi:imidazoleglycerol phosphate dehydratase HisB
MKLWIETAALAGPSDQLLWNGALFGLTYLREFGHYSSFNIGELTREQQNLLHHESLHTESFKKTEADLSVDNTEEELALYIPDNERQLFNDWIELSRAVCFPRRVAHLHRNTAETEIKIQLNLDGKGKNEIHTGLPFFDHMLQQIARHGLIDLSLSCEGDLEVDEHHTIEDTAIALGTAIRRALGKKLGINRYGFALPMDESEAVVLLDFSGRPYLKFEGRFEREKVGGFPTEMVEHFFYSLAMSLEADLHIKVEGRNDHHKIEACFKSFAHCLRAGISRSERSLNILPSTKELL